MHGNGEPVLNKCGCGVFAELCNMHIFFFFGSFHTVFWPGDNNGWNTSGICVASVGRMSAYFSAPINNRLEQPHSTPEARRAVLENNSSRVRKLRCIKGEGKHKLASSCSFFEHVETFNLMWKMLPCLISCSKIKFHSFIHVRQTSHTHTVSDTMFRLRRLAYFFCEMLVILCQNRPKNQPVDSHIGIIPVTFTVVSTFWVLSFKIKPHKHIFVRIPSFKDLIVKHLKDLVV